MTVPIWPDVLPRPERNTWNAQHQDSRQRRRSEAGPPTYGRRFSSAARMVPLSIVIDRDLKAIFDNFYSDETRKGALPFWMPDPTTEGWALLTHDKTPILIAGGPDDGKPLLLGAKWLCSFGDQLPAETIVGVQFRMSFSVVVLP